MDALGMGGDSQDYAAAAEKQYANNVETARTTGYLNNPNIISPQGQHTVTFDPVTMQPTIRDTLNPVEDWNYKTQQDIGAMGLNSLKAFGMPAIDKALASDFSLPGGPQTDFSAAYKPTKGMTYDVTPDPMQKSLDYSGAPQMPVANAGVRDQVARSIYDQGASMLDPQFAQQQKALDTHLSNQGVFQGSEAYQGGQSALGTQRTQAYNDLIQRAIQGGGDAMQQLFDMGMGARQQGVSEINTQGDFVNNAQNQDYTQQMGRMTGSNAAIGEQYGIAGNAASLANAGRSQGLSEMSFAKTAPINAMSAILSGTQVQQPTSMQYNPSAIETAPIFQGAQATGAAQTASANRMSGLIGQGISAAGSIM
ncbi:MAG TPA: hypothetical protein VNS88_07925 [Nitrospiraceae bacterium]|nr:hypothetical protein [Nitrospiraceae bacterium]